MTVLIDCHMHTERCGHASGSVDQMVGAAVFGGLSAIVMTEHLPLPDTLNPEGHLAPPADQLVPYALEVRAMADRVKDLDVILGAEADWLPFLPEAMETQAAVAREAGIDVLLGSVHCIDGWTFDDPTDLSEWERRDVDEVWYEYFALWCDAARSGRFDVMAHPDLVKKFGHVPSFDTRELFAEAARAAADFGVLIEVSTAGLRKPVGELYPSSALLAAFRTAGVDVTVGSDAHSPAEVGWGITTAYEACIAAGYEKVTLPLGGGERRWIQL